MKFHTSIAAELRDGYPARAPVSTWLLRDRRKTWSVGLIQIVVDGIRLLSTQDGERVNGSSDGVLVVWNGSNWLVELV